MILVLKKFGTVLTSRQLGKEAYAAAQPLLSGLGEDETLEVDFEGVTTFSPSWGDEFLTPLFERFADRIVLSNTENPSVKATLKFLREL